MRPRLPPPIGDRVLAAGGGETRSSPKAGRWRGDSEHFQAFPRVDNERHVWSHAEVKVGKELDIGFRRDNYAVCVPCPAGAGGGETWQTSLPRCQVDIRACDSSREWGWRKAQLVLS